MASYQAVPASVKGLFLTPLLLKQISRATLYRLLGALGYSLAQFGAVFDAVTEAEIDAHMALQAKGK